MFKCVTHPKAAFHTFRHSVGERSHTRFELSAWSHAEARNPAIDINLRDGPTLPVRSPMAGVGIAHHDLQVMGLTSYFCSTPRQSRFNFLYPKSTNGIRLRLPIAVAGLEPDLRVMSPPVIPFTSPRQFYLVCNVQSIVKLSTVSISNHTVTVFPS